MCSSSRSLESPGSIAITPFENESNQEASSDAEGRAHSYRVCRGGGPGWSVQLGEDSVYGFYWAQWAASRFATTMRFLSKRVQSTPTSITLFERSW